MIMTILIVVTMITSLHFLRFCEYESVSNILKMILKENITQAKKQPSIISTFPVVKLLQRPIQNARAYGGSFDKLR